MGAGPQRYNQESDMGTFKNTVYVTDPETGQSQWFHPGDDAPSWTKGLVADENFEGSGDDDGESDGVYSDLTVAELKDLLEDRGLPVSGAKAELIERLEANDAESEG